MHSNNHSFDCFKVEFNISQEEDCWWFQKEGRRRSNGDSFHSLMVKYHFSKCLWYSSVRCMHFSFERLEKKYPKKPIEISSFFIFCMNLSNEKKFQFFFLNTICFCFSSYLWYAAFAFHIVFRDESVSALRVLTSGYRCLKDTFFCNSLIFQHSSLLLYFFFHAALQPCEVTLVSEQQSEAMSLSLKFKVGHIACITSHVKSLIFPCHCERQLWWWSARQWESLEAEPNVVAASCSISHSPFHEIL